MRFSRMVLLPVLLAAAAFVGSASATGASSGGRAGSAGSTGYVECQHPVRTGVEVSKLVGITSASACPVALALFRWEENGKHWSTLYGCKGANAMSPGTPFLKLQVWQGWTLAFSMNRGFTMSKGSGSFVVSGTDFPINCS